MTGEENERIRREGKLREEEERKSWWREALRIGNGMDDE